VPDSIVNGHAGGRLSPRASVERAWKFYHRQACTLSLEAGGGILPVRITDNTRIWVDRSSARLSNLDGDTSDLATGRRVEVSYTDPASRQSADWVKVGVGN
jgi:hypothetical protein